MMLRLLLIQGMKHLILELEVKEAFQDLSVPRFLVIMFLQGKVLVSELWDNIMHLEAEIQTEQQGFRPKPSRTRIFYSRLTFTSLPTAR